MENLKVAFRKKSKSNETILKIPTALNVLLSFLGISMAGWDRLHCHTRVIIVVRISNFIQIRTRHFLGEREAPVREITFP